MRKGWVALGAILAGGLIAIIALVVGGDEPAQGPDWPDPTAARTARGGAPDAGVSPDDHRPRRLLEVAVTTCHGMPVEGAMVVSEAGGERLSAKSDADGYARLRVLTGKAKVVARVATYERETMPDDASNVAVDLCPGASLHGQVLDGWGAQQPGVTLALVDENGETLDTIEADEEGAYALNDLALDARGVIVDGQLQPLTPLVAREDREMDLLVGQTRVVRGFVLDLAGDPVAGVLVTLKPMAFESRGWSAMTDNGGGFSIVGPITMARVEADGGDMGKDRAWVDGSAEEKVVDLVLEPVALITVVKPDSEEPDAKVSIRCWDQKSMGEDSGWINGPQSPEDMAALYGEGPYPEEVGGEGLGEVLTEDQPVEPAVIDPPPDPQPDLGPNPVLMAKLMRRIVKEIAPELEPDGAGDLEPQAYVQALQARFEALTPEEQKKLQSSVTEERMMAIIQEELGGDLSQLYAPHPVEPEPATAEAQPVEVDNEGEVGGEPDIDIEPDPGSGYYIPEPASDFAVNVDEVPTIDEPGVGDGTYEGETLDYAEPDYIEPTYTPSEIDRYATYVEGVLGETFSVPASQWYDIYVERPDGTELPCGRVRVEPGDEITVQCGGDDVATTIEGRFVGKNGKPVANLSLWYTASSTQDSDLYVDAKTTTDRDGRFSIRIDHDKPMTLSVGVDSPASPDAYGSYGRRNVAIVPGEDKDLGDLLWLEAEERPESWPTTAYGGIGGMISLDDDGVTVLDMEEDSPLAMAGVEKNDVIVMIDEVPAAELPQDEVFTRLRGEPGTEVALRLRSAIGELYEVTLTRAMMPAPSESWGDGSGGGEVDPPPPQDPYFEF